MQKRNDGSAKTIGLVCGKVSIHDFKRVEFFEADLDGNHLLLSGPNASGKTSVLDAVLSLLGLVKGREIPEPIRQGAVKAELYAELIDQLTGSVCFRLKQEWNGKARVYTVHDAEGKPVAIRTFQALIDPYLVNPVDLLSLRGQDLQDEVLRALGIGPPVSEVRGITGEGHLAREGETASAYLERLSADETGLFYDRRRVKAWIREIALTAPWRIGAKLPRGKSPPM